MIIPFSTDAPIYHWPRATLALILANVGVHIAWSLGSPESFEPLALRLGEGLHPVQWLTHNFLHADFLHLFGNMIFLWVYGIIVEGKLNWFPFLMSYLAIGTVHGAVIQAAYLGAAEPGYVIGASGAIFGLMAICMIWAPVNEITCFYFFLVGFRAISNVVDVPIYAFALFQLGLQLLSVAFQTMIHGDPMSSALLHISGAFWGLVLGMILLRTNLVDCEGWDVFSMIRKRRDLKRKWREREARLDRSRELERAPRSLIEGIDRPGMTSEERSQAALKRLRSAVDAADAQLIASTYQKWSNAQNGPPPPKLVLELIQSLLDREEWVAALPLLRASSKPDDASPRLRLKLAMILIRHRERPTEALRWLDMMRPETLEPNLRKAHTQLRKEALAMIEDGVVELEEDV